MRIFKIVFFSVFLIYHLVVFYFAAYINDVFSFIIGNIDKLKYGAIFGLLLYVVNIALFVLEGKKGTQHIKNLEQDKTTLKAKMYDLEEEIKNLKHRPNPESEDTQVTSGD